MAKKFRLTNKQKGWLLSTHLLFITAWFGGTMCLLVLTIAASSAVSRDELYVTFLNMNVIDDVFIKYPAMGALVTGLLLSALTNWGLFNYYWIIVKQILTLAIISFGIFGLNRWLDAATVNISATGSNALQVSAFASHRNMLLIGAVMKILAMAATLVISSLKPWGKRTQQNERASA